MAVPDYYNRVNPDLLRVIPPDARSVLEVGCGTGAMAEAYRAIHPTGRYLGIEKDPEAAAIAASRLDRVIVGDIDAIDLAAAGLELNSFDALVFGDVLEHMVDPWGVLKRLAPLLRDGGLALACIPNVQHWSMIVGLLRGRWEYQDEGLLDRTHLRFFTVEGMTPLFEGAGLKVFDVHPRWWPSPDIDTFSALMAPVVEALGLDPVQFQHRTRALQYVVRSVKAPEPPRKVLVQTLIGEPMVCARVRVIEPDAALGTIPGVRVVASTEAPLLGHALPDEAKILVRQRNILLERDHLEGQAALANGGYLIVAEFDDDPAHFREIEANRFLTFTSCHCVQTSTEELARRIRAYNPHVKVFANQIARLPPLRPDRPDGPVVLFFGALNREVDWAPIVPGLNRVLARREKAVRLEVVHDWGFYDAVETEHKTFERFCPYERYAEILRTADIALLPLEPSPFNLCKSDLKFLECAAHGVVALAGPTVYGETIRDDETGVIFHDGDDFEAKLDLLIDDAERRRAIAEAAYRYVADERMLAGHFRERYDWYREMLDRKDELDRDLRERVPAMFASR